MNGPAVVPPDLVAQLHTLAPDCEAHTSMVDPAGRVHPTNLRCPGRATWIITVVGPCGHPQKSAICAAHHDYSHQVRPMVACPTCGVQTVLRKGCEPL